MGALRCFTCIFQLQRERNKPETAARDPVRYVSRWSRIRGLRWDMSAFGLIATAVTLVTIAPAAFAGCLHFTGPHAGSACESTSTEVVWLNPPAVREVADPEPYPALNHTYDPLLSDSAFFAGVYAGGNAHFQVRMEGKYLFEVFLTATDVGERPYVLESNGIPVDRTYRRTPGIGRKRWRHITLLGIVNGGKTLTIRTDSPRYLLKAVRWTPVDEFERKLVPAWLARVRYLFENPIFGVYEYVRAEYLEQLLSLLALSEDESVSREALVGLTRVVYWLVAEGAEPRDLERLPGLLDESWKRAPGDRILRQTISAACRGAHATLRRASLCSKVSAIPWDMAPQPAPAGAPAWAVEQRKLAARMEAITRWWVEKRQQANGELGGGWDDDVEILRTWGLQALGLGSSVAARGITRMAEGIWSSGMLRHGYAKRISDAEHSAEPTSDTLPMLAALIPGEQSAVAKLAETSACAQNWIAAQPDGNYRFRGSWFNCREIDPTPERAIDVHYNVRAMGPALWYAFLTRDPALVDLLKKWAESWVVAMRSSLHGKPAGVFPPVIKAVDGSFLIASDRWDRPNAEWDYYRWSGGSQEALTSLVLAVYDLTKDARWLHAAGESFRILDHCTEAPGLCDEIVRAPQAFYEWRRLSNNPRYDQFFKYEEKHDPAAILSLMARQAREQEARLAVNFEMLTSEVLFTDRCGYSLPTEYIQQLFGGDAPRGERYPTFAVTWPVVEGDFARAVMGIDPTTIRLRLYNFEPNEIVAKVRAWRLQHGRYRLVILNGRRTLMQSEVDIRERPQTIEFPIPSRREVTIVITRVRS